MEQRIFNQTNTMYRGAMDAARMGNEKLPPRSFSGGQYGQRLTDIRRDFQTNKNQHSSNYSLGYPEDMKQRHSRDLPNSLTSLDRSAISTLEDMRIDHLGQAESQLTEGNRSNARNLDSFRNYQNNLWRSTGSSSWNDWNPTISDMNSEISYRRTSPEPDVRLEFRTSRNERSPDRCFRTDTLGGIWQSSPERYRENINSNRSFSQAANIPGRFDNNLRMQREPTNSVRQDIFSRRGNSTATSSLMDTERILGYRSATSGLRHIEQSFRFEPPSDYNLARRGIPSSFVRNKSNRLPVGSGYVGSSASTTFTKPIDIPTPSQNRKRKRKRNNPIQSTNENTKKPKADPFSTSLQLAADAINALMDMKSTAVLPGTLLATGQNSGASITQPSETPGTPAKKKKKKKKKANKKPEAVAPSVELKHVKVIKDVKGVKETKDVDVKDLKNMYDLKRLKVLRNPMDLKYLLAIVPRNYPLQKMTVEQTALVKNALVQEIEKMDDKSVVPQVASCYRLRGSLMVFWNNDTGAEFLRKVVKTLKPWDGACFRVIQQSPHIFTWTVIVHDEFPNKCMTPEQLNAVYEALTTKMDEVPDEKQPQFIETHHRRGTIMVAYSKQKDFEWMKNALQDLQPWEGAKLRLLDIDDVPVYNKIEMTLPFPDSDFDGILERLGRQNQGLDTSDWHLFGRRIKQDGRKLIVSVKDDVIEALEKVDYKPFLNLNRITVVNLGKIKKIPFSVSDYEEELKTLKKAKTHLMDRPKKADATPVGIFVSDVAQTEPADGDVGVVE